MGQADAAGGEDRQSVAFLLLYGLAWAGGAIAYVPFLTILLPLRASYLAAGDNITWLAYVTFVGAIAASIANVGFGWASDRASDRIRGRRIWIGAGLFFSNLFLLGFAWVETLPGLMALIICWQFGLNMMLAPLAAWAGDFVPHGQKGVLGGMISLAPAMGALSGMFVTIPGLVGQDGRLLLVTLLVSLCILPVLLFGRPRPMPLLQAQKGAADDGRKALSGFRLPDGRVLRMWFARLLVQVAEAALFAFLFFWFRSIDGEIGDNDIARIFAIVLTGAVPVALLAGRWSDRVRKPVSPLIICSAFSAAGLVCMAFSSTLWAAIGGYILFGLSSTIFLSLHSSQTLWVLPRAETRGRDLGIFNLTNTVPSLIIPWLTLALVPLFGFGALFLLLALLVFAACLLLVTFPREN